MVPASRVISASRWLLASAVAGGGLFGTAHPAAALPVPASGYTISPFATAPAGATAPDSIVVDGGSVFVGFGNGNLPDGSDGKSNTIAQYTTSGKLVRTFTVPGHNDGLRVDPATHLLYAMQNEDSNPNLQVINPTTGTQTPYTFGPTPHGGGYDDIVFLGGKVYFSASNPTLDAKGITTGPALVQGTLGAGTVSVTPVLQGNAAATDVTTGKPVTLNMTDPDSTTIDPAGNIVVDSQADAELSIVHNPGTAAQFVTRLAINDGKGGPVALDDTLYLPGSKGAILLTDTKSTTIYAVRSDTFAAGSAFSNSADSKFFGSLDQTTGTLTPVVTGLGSPHGLAFLPASAVPVPNAAYVGLAGLAGVIAARYSRRAVR